MSNNFGSVYQSPRFLSLLTVGGLAACLLIDILAALFGLGGLFAPYQIDLDNGNGESIWIIFIGVLTLLEIAAYIFTVVVFLMWLYRAYKNLPALRAQHLEHTPGWAVGWWFIPFANLVKPYQVVRETWIESDPDYDPDVFMSNGYGAPSLLGWWWGFWLAGNISANIAGRIGSNDNLISDGSFFAAYAVASILGIGAALLAIEVVRGITKRQEERFQKIGVNSVNLPPPPPTFN